MILKTNVAYSEYIVNIHRINNDFLLKNIMKFLSDIQCELLYNI